MGNVLIVYSSNYGQAARIARAIYDVVLSHGHAVALEDVNDVDLLDLSKFDVIIAGGSIRYGRHSRALTAFCADNGSTLNSKRSHFFSVSAVARKPHKCTPIGNPYVAPFLVSTGWTPDCIAVFAGMIDYSLYRLVDRIMIKLIMKLTGKPVDAKKATEFTDWDAVHSFGNKICEDLIANDSTSPPPARE